MLLVPFQSLEQNVWHMKHEGAEVYLGSWVQQIWSIVDLIQGRNGMAKKYGGEKSLTLWHPRRRETKEEPSRTHFLRWHPQSPNSFHQAPPSYTTASYDPLETLPLCLPSSPLCPMFSGLENLLVVWGAPYLQGIPWMLHAFRSTPVSDQYFNDSQHFDVVKTQWEARKKAATIDLMVL